MLTIPRGHPVHRTFRDAMPTDSPRSTMIGQRAPRETGIRLLLLCASLLLTLLLSACQTETIEEQTNRRLKRSQAYQQQGQYRAAIIEARNAIHLAPERLDAHIQLARVYNELGYYNSTLNTLADLSTSADADVILEKATAYYALKKYRSALQLLQGSNAAYDAAQLSRYQLLVGQSLIGLGRVDEGRQYLQRASTGAADTPAMLAIAQLDALMDDSASAWRIINQLLGSTPDDPDVLLLAGKIALYQSSLDRAEEYLTDALYALPITDIMLPKRIQTLQILSRVLTLNGNPHEAVIYNHILSENVPEYVETRDGILESLALIEDNKLDEAEEKLLTLLEAGGNDNAGALLGIVNFLQGDVSEASELLSAHLDPETANSQALELLVSAKFQLNELDQVLSILGPEVQTRDDNASLLGLYGLAKLARQDWGGVKHIKRSLELNPENSRLRLALAAFYQQRGKPEEAMREARLAYQHDPSNQMAQGALIQLLVLNQKITEARALTDEMANADPNNGDTQAMTGITYLRLQDHEAAWKHLRRAVEINPENGTAWLALARLALTEQDYEAAATYFAYVIDILPHNAAGYKGLVSTWEAKGEPKRAVEALRQHAKQDPDNGIPPAVLAEYHLLNAQYDEAHQQITLALDRLAGNDYIGNVAVRIFLQNARLALRQGEPGKARDKLTEGLSYLPNTPNLLILLARCHIMEDKPEAALAIASTLETLMPATAWELKGDALSPSDPAAALQAYYQAWQLTPSSTLGRKLYSLEANTSPARAEAFKAQWQAQLPNDPGLLFVKAIESRNRGQQLAAIRAYEELLTLEPENVSALNNLAWLYYEANRNEALSLARQAFELEPENPVVLDTYGMALIAQGQRDEGIAMLGRARKLAPGSDEIKQHLKQAERR